MFPNDTPIPPSPAPWADTSELDQAPAPAWIVPSQRFEAPDEPAPPESTVTPIEPVPSMSTLAPEAPATTPAEVPPQPTPDMSGAYEQEIASLKAQLAQTVQDVTSIRRTLLEASERELVRLSLVIAEKIVGRELTVDPALVADWARQGLKTLSDQDDLSVMVSADILEAVPEDAWRTAKGETLVPKVDPQLPPGSCSVVGELSRVDASLSGRLGAVSDALGPGEEEEEE